MRLWSLAPDYLDRQGLAACWREALLAQAVLAGRTKGYRDHPQLARFRATPDPLAAVGDYLEGVAAEASARTYS
ncbi:pyrimidine dimer DNA glycosylase/endonuclease V, partial [Isoptericola sp. NPDC060257]